MKLISQLFQPGYYFRSKILSAGQIKLDKLRKLPNELGKLNLEEAICYVRGTTATSWEGNHHLPSGWNPFGSIPE